MNPPTTAIGAKYPLGTPATAVLASLDPTRTNTGKPNTPPTNGSSNLAASTKYASLIALPTKNDFLGRRRRRTTFYIVLPAIGLMVMPKAVAPRLHM